MTEELIIEYANKCVNVLGRKVKANRIIRSTDENNKPKIDKEEIVFERTFEKFGFELSFLEENDVHLAIFFEGELVFNTVADAYKVDDYDCSSPILRKLFDEDDNPAGRCFIHGEWEDLLKKIADNAKKLKEVLEKLTAETKKLHQVIAYKNELMVKHLPFRNFGNRHFYQDNEYHVECVNGMTRVYPIELSGFLAKKVDFKDCVFDASINYYAPGPWEQHIEAILNKEVAKMKKDKDFDPVTLKSNSETQAEAVQSQIEKKSAMDYMDEIDSLI